MRQNTMKRCHERQLSRFLVIALIAGMTWAPEAIAQWVTQSITLRAGWNAVFLEIQPETPNCDTWFATYPIESVWLWNRRFSAVQFITDASALIPGDPDWLTWLPPTSASRSVMNLHSLLGGHTYLIKVAANAAPFALNLLGNPANREAAWISDSFNFVGFPISSVSPPTFQSLFAPSPAHAGNPIYRLFSNGTWSQVSPGTDRLQPGEAFWAFCSGRSSYSGLLSVAFEQGHGLDYDRDLVEETLRIQNNSTSARIIVVRPLSSAAPMSGNYPALAGDVPLAYWKMSFPSNVGFFPLPATLTNTLPAGGVWSLRLAVVRTNMAPYTPPPGVGDFLYQSLLEVTDGAGSRLLVPVTARRSQTLSGASLANHKLSGTGSGQPSPMAGLWVGSAVIRKVSQPSNPTDPSTPLPTPAEFQFRLLVHVDDSGQARLLQKAYLMWKDGTYTNNPDGFRVVDKPGQYVLVTSDRFLGQFQGSSYQDGRQVGRRFSSTAFAFREPTLMTTTNGTAAFGADGSFFSCLVPLAHDDPLNPFIHRYHPDHNNLEERSPWAPLQPTTNSFGLLETSKSFAVNRQIQLAFTATDQEGVPLPGYGDTRLGGVYAEAITGLHKRELRVEGIFNLQRASRIGQLNDGQGL
jgi:hypothetical protein